MIASHAYRRLTARADWRVGALLPDREVVFAYVSIAPVLVATVTWSYLLEYDTWRLDIMQAADRAGLYLFLLNPCYAALAAWTATRRKVALGEAADGLPARSLIWRSSWGSYAVLGLGAHVVVLGLMVITAMCSNAVGTVDLLPVVVQLLSVPFFTAGGAACGGRWASRLTAPALLLVLLLLNTLLIQYGFRRVSEVGTGSADFIDLELSARYLLPKLVLYASLSLFAWPARSWATGRMRLITVALAAVALASFLHVFTSDGEAQVYSPTRPACHSSGDGVRICVPQDLRDRAHAFDGPIARVRDILGSTGITNVPSRVDVVSRGATTLRHGSVVVTVAAPDLQSASRRQRIVDFGFAYAQSCDDPTSSVGPPESILITRALLDGWLQHQTKSVEPGSYPVEDLTALLRLPHAQRLSTLQRLFTAVWRCESNVRPFGAGR